jgi:hypothetical protein
MLTRKEQAIAKVLIRARYGQLGVKKAAIVGVFHFEIEFVLENAVIVATTQAATELF